MSIPSYRFQNLNFFLVIILVWNCFLKTSVQKHWFCSKLFFLLIAFPLLDFKSVICKINTDTAFPKGKNKALQRFTWECLLQSLCDLELFVKYQWWLFRVSHQNWFSVSKEGSACNVSNSWGKGNNYMSALFSFQKEHFPRLTHYWG